MIFGRGGLSSANPFALTDKYGISSGFQNTSGRATVSAALSPGERTVVIVSFGQSQAANHGRGLYSVTNTTKVQNLNVHDGLIYELVEPVLGPTFTINGYAGWNSGYGSYMGALGDALIADDLYDRVIIAPIAIGGVPAKDYIASGIYRHWLHAVLLRIRAYYPLAGTENFEVVCCWHQGETDALTVALGGVETPTDTYIAYMQDIIAFVRNFGLTGKFFVPKCTWVGSNPGDHTVARIRDAQAAVVNPANNVFAGPDFDALGAGYRDDGLHFGLASGGIATVAGMWADALAATS